MNLNYILTASDLKLLEDFSPLVFRQLNSFFPKANLNNVFFEKAFNFLKLKGDINYQKLLFLAADENLITLQKKLRKLKILVFAVLIVADLKKEFSTVKIMAKVSEFAKFTLEISLLLAEKLTKEKFSLNNLGFSPVIIGMGKLGGAELNYSSDVDLVYLFSAQDNFEFKIVNYFFTIVTKLLGELTAEGFVFRVDLELRPLGKEGPLAQSTEEALSYLLTFGRPWERLAWLRALPIAGDIKLGESFLKNLEPFVYRRHLDYLALEELAILKNKMLMEHSLKSLTQLNVKLTSGGIREMEFLSQSLLLTFAGKNLALRTTSFLDSLNKLNEYKIINNSEKDELTESYLFLRDVEHRVQMVCLAQTHCLPKGESELNLLAAAMGFKNKELFLEKLKYYLTQNALKFNKLLAIFKVENKLKFEIKEKWLTDFFSLINIDLEKQKNILFENGFLNPEKALEDINYILKAEFLPANLERYEVRLHNLLPIFLKFSAQSPDPNLALSRLTRFLTAIGPRAGYLIMLEDKPKLIEILLLALGSSGFLAELIITHPGLLDAQVSSKALNLIKSQEEINLELNKILSFESDLEQRLAMIRRYKNEEFLRLGLVLLTGELEWEKVSIQLTQLAEEVIAQTLILAAESVLKTKINLEQLPVLIAFVGKMGGCELNYLSDLDLLFFVEEGAEALGVKIIQRFYNFLTLSHLEGPGYELDNRLRPSGVVGPLVVTIESFKKYHQNSQLWEKQVLTKFRAGLGCKKLLKEINVAVKSILNGFKLPEKADFKMHEMWQRINSERAMVKKDYFNLKFQEGGLVMAEFLAQYLFLKSEKKNLALQGTANILLSLGDEFLPLAKAYNNLSEIVAYLSLVIGRQGDKAVYSYEDLKKINFLVKQEALGQYIKSIEIIEKYYNKYFNLR